MSTDKIEKKIEKEEAKALNRDPITGAPGAHPVGTGLGAAGGGTAGLVAGAAVAGPVGAIAGAAIGAVAGGLAGKSAAEAIDPTAEETYWRTTYITRAYVKPGSSYDDYGPAYRYGWESAAKYPGRNFEDVETDLRQDWDRSRGRSKLDWDRAKPAVKDSWHRIYHQ
jgi:hypothetical protein